MGGWGKQNDYAPFKRSSVYKWWLITDLVGGVQNGQNIDHVILEWPLNKSYSIAYILR